MGVWSNSFFKVCLVASTLPIYALAAQVPNACTQILFISSRGDTSFDLYRMNPDGSGQVAITSNPGMDWSPRSIGDGIIQFNSMVDGQFGIYIVQLDGSNRRRLETRGLEEYILSPTGDRILFTMDFDGDSEIFVARPDGTGRHNITSNPAYDGRPTWSPDGTRVVFVSDRDGNNEIYTVASDGLGLRRLTFTESREKYSDWSPDGEKIVFTSERDGGPEEIYVMNADGSNQVRLTHNDFYDGEVAWSPDGSLIAFHSERGGEHEIWTVTPDGGTETRLTFTPHYEGEPAWINSRCP